MFALMFRDRSETGHKMLSLAETSEGTGAALCGAGATLRVLPVVLTVRVLIGDAREDVG